MKWKSKYIKAFSVGLQSSMEYRGDFLLGMLSAIFPIIIQIFMWGNIYGGSGSNVKFGYTYSQMIIYSVMASIVSRLVRTGFEYEINDDIKNGGLNKFIVRPVSYFPYRMSCFLGQKTVQTAFVSVFLFGIIAFLCGYFGYAVSTASAVGFIFALVFAFMLNFIIFFCVGMIAFWLSEIGFFFEAVRIVFIVFSGGIFPLDIFGDRVKAVLDLMPFKYTVNFPVDVLNGRVQAAEIPAGIVVQVLWIIALSGLSVVLWKLGTKKYVAVGG